MAIIGGGALIYRRDNLMTTDHSLSVCGDKWLDYMSDDSERTQKSINKHLYRVTASELLLCKETPPKDMFLFFNMF